jgi:hypothetical protein
MLLLGCYGYKIFLRVKNPLERKTMTASNAENSAFFRALKGADLMEPTAITTLVADAGAEYFQNDAAASVLEYMETRVAGTAGGAPKAISFAQAEQRALADPSYEAHIEMMVSARKNANLSRVRYDMGRMYLELQRSANATRRQEMAMNGTTRPGPQG